MTLSEARAYLANYAANPAPCLMTRDAAFELVSYSDNMTDEPVRVNGQVRWWAENRPLKDTK